MSVQRWLLPGWSCLVLYWAGPVCADVWSEPSPFRREAVVEGRGYEYDSRSFLNRLSYRPLGPSLAAEDGIQGTAGSVSSTELYLDVSLQKTLHFDDQRQHVRVNMQRTEDFDGPFDRQRFGYRLGLGDWHLGVAGDVRADKAETDVYFALGWSPSHASTLEVQAILPDAYLNQKGEGAARYDGAARSWYLAWRHQRDGLQWQWVLNSTPAVSFRDAAADLEAQAEQHRALLAWVAGEEWQWLGRLEAERADRTFVMDPQGAATERAFRRRMHAGSLAVRAAAWPLTPSLGVYYLRLEEDGWLGMARSETVRVRHDEPYLVASVEQALGTRLQWQPTVYVGRSRMVRETLEDPDGNSFKDRASSKLSLPFSYLAEAGSGARLTLSPSFYLHQPKFGGGNLQLYWPL